MVETKLKQVGLHLLWFDVKSVKGRKEGKDEEKKKERPFGQWVRKEAQRKWELIQSWRTAWVRVSRREEKNRESKRKLWEIYSEEECVKKKISLFKLYL